MTHEIDRNDAFMQDLLARVPSEPWSGRRVFMNREGDCLEVLLSNDSYRAERLDSLLTVYVNRESGELVGALVKGVRSFIRRMGELHPGFKIEIMDGRVRLEYLFAAGMWLHGAPDNRIMVQRYQTLRQIAEDARLEIELEPEMV